MDAKIVVFCDQDETIQHLLFSCPLAKMIWRIVYMAFSIRPPNDIRNLFGNWLQGVSKKEKVQIRVGVCALLWALWNVRNDYFLQSKENFIYAGYPDGYSLDPYVVLPTINGEARCNGFWVQPPGIGRVGSIFTVQPAF